MKKLSKRENKEMKIVEEQKLKEQQEEKEVP